jgi:type IV fimbrial biogenesis protein FimT
MRTSINRQQGFTLTELLTAMAVMAITVSVAIPGFQATMNNNRRTTAVNELFNTMQSARSEAITRNAQVTVCPSSNGLNCEAVGWEKGWIYFPDTNRNRTVDAGELVLGASEERKRLTVTSAEFGGFLAYRPNGRAMVNVAAQNTGNLVICDPRGADEARVLIIDASGQPRVADHMLNGAAPACPG